MYVDDEIILIKPYKDLNIGTKGKIVHKYNEEEYMVEFYNKYGIVFALYTLTIDYLELIDK